MDRSEAARQPHEAEPPKPDKAERQQRELPKRSPEPASLPMPSQWLPRLPKKARSAETWVPLSAEPPRQLKVEPKAEPKAGPKEKPQAQQPKKELKEEPESSQEWTETPGVKEIKEEPQAQQPKEEPKEEQESSQAWTNTSSQDWTRQGRREAIKAAMQRAAECTACSGRSRSKGCAQCLGQWESSYRLTEAAYLFWVGQAMPKPDKSQRV